MKRCNKCGTEKDDSCFRLRKNKGVVVGLISWCRECERAGCKKWYRSNPEWVAEHRDEKTAIATQWKRNNRLRARDHNRLSEGSVRAGGGKVTIEQWHARLEEFGYCCAYCSVELGDDRTIDHVHPISKGGKHHIDNIVPACIVCNMSKSGRMLVDWLMTGGPPRLRKKAA